MRKVGSTVLFLKTSKENPRNGESTMIRLKDGRIMFAYTEYCGQNWEDHGSARISARYSSDEGNTWSSSTVIIQKPADAQNIMSPSLIRMANGNLGIVYLRKDIQQDGGITCMPQFAFSTDEGITFCNGISCGFPLGYYCAVNDSAIVTANGRIYVPASYSGQRIDALGIMNPKPVHNVSDIRIVYSDDNGLTWHQYHKVFSSPFSYNLGLFEPGLYEHQNGDMWMYARTAFGHQYQSISSNNGGDWSDVEPNFCFPTPDSPMRVKKVGKYVVAVYNPISYNCLQTETELWKSPKRTPIVVTVSENDGMDFSHEHLVLADVGLLKITYNTYLLEDDMTQSYCYPSIVEVNDGFLVSYYHSDGTNRCLNASKIVKVRYDELDRR